MSNLEDKARNVLQRVCVCVWGGGGPEVLTTLLCATLKCYCEVHASKCHCANHRTSEYHKAFIVPDRETF